jgi:hypothetical protein
MNKIVYMSILAFYEGSLATIRIKGMKKGIKDDITDAIIKIIPIVICIIGALG